MTSISFVAQTQTKRLDALRSDLLCESGVVKPYAKSAKTICNTINEYLGTDQEDQLNIFDQAIRAQLKSIKEPSLDSVAIMDAREAGMNHEEVAAVVTAISEKELASDIGWVHPSQFVKEKYFIKETLKPSLSTPEFILLAKIEKRVVGFLITSRKKLHRGDDDYQKKLCSVDVAYLAVESSFKRLGIGTKLMLSAMAKAKALGKRYLTLEYIAGGLGVKEELGATKIAFYGRFTSRFGIPTERAHLTVCRVLHVFPYYDLEECDFNV
jgi:predicted N-acetyltransferase YhbS